ncbi:MAG: hypothetical protein H6943_08895 [Zoogloeaceae bacterium]|nr:hypothetical protein [Zoogloeaceae bacterium]
MEQALYKLTVRFFLGGRVNRATMSNPLSKKPRFFSLASGLGEAHACDEARRAYAYPISLLTRFLLVCIGVQIIGSGIRSFIAGT